MMTDARIFLPGLPDLYTRNSSMEMEEKHIAELYPELEEWIRYCQYAEDELRSFHHSMKGLEAKYADPDILTEIAYYHLQANEMQKAVEDMLRALQLATHALSELEKHRPGAETMELNDHAILRRKFDNFQEEFDDYRHAFHGFLLKWI